jgi:hypothetical protein
MKLASARKPYWLSSIYRVYIKPALADLKDLFHAAICFDGLKSEPIGAEVFAPPCNFILR